MILDVETRTFQSFRGLVDTHDGERLRQNLRIELDDTIPRTTVDLDVEEIAELVAEAHEARVDEEIAIEGS